MSEWQTLATLALGLLSISHLLMVARMFFMEIEIQLLKERLHPLPNKTPAEE